MDFASSDHHFFHFNVIKYASRPFTTTEEMNQYMIDKWNSVVSPDDRIFHVGDCGFANKEKMKIILDQLNGEKILIKGNHDGNAKRMMELGFKEVHNSLELEIGGQKVLLCHYPYRPTQEEMDKSDYELKHVNSRPEDKGGWLIHGHTHNLWKFKNKMINVSVENWDYTPVSFQTIEQIMKENPDGFKNPIIV